MYTVFRFKGQDDKLEEVGQIVNSCSPGLYDGPDRVGNRFSCSVSRADAWHEHCDAIRHLLDQLHPAIETAHRLGFVLEFDVAVMKEEYSERWITEVTFSADLVHVLQKHEIAICVTVYGHGPAIPGTRT